MGWFLMACSEPVITSAVRCRVALRRLPSPIGALRAARVQRVSHFEWPGTKAMNGHRGVTSAARALHVATRRVASDTMHGADGARSDYLYDRNAHSRGVRRALFWLSCAGAGQRHD